MNIESNVEGTATETSTEVETTDTAETVESTESEAKETTESPEARLARLKRQTRQLEKKLGLDTKADNKRTKSDDLDYGELAYLTAKGIESDNEVEKVRSIMAETGKSLKDVVASKYFQAELKESREARAAQDAIPKGTKRSSNSSVSDVDYWIAKDEMPADTGDNRELRTKIVNEKIRRESNKNIFGTSGKVIIK